MNIGIIGSGMVAIAHLTALQRITDIECIYQLANNEEGLKVQKLLSMAIAKNL